MPQCENAGMNKWQGNMRLVAAILVLRLQKKKKKKVCQVRGSVNTLGSMYAITIKQNINTAMFGLVKKRHAYQKHFMLNSTPPRLYRFNIKLVLSKSIQITGREIVHPITNYFWLIRDILGFFSFKYTWSSAFGPFHAQRMNTMEWDGTLIIWLKMSLKGKWMSTVVKTVGLDSVYWL